MKRFAMDGLTDRLTALMKIREYKNIPPEEQKASGQNEILKTFRGLKKKAG